MCCFLNNNLVSLSSPLSSRHNEVPSPSLIDVDFFFNFGSLMVFSIVVFIAFNRMSTSSRGMMM